MRKLIFVCILVILVFTSSFPLGASAIEEISVSDRIRPISCGGDSSEAEPYSAEAIRGAIDLGFYAVSLKVGEDGVEAKELPEILSFTKGKICVILDCSEDNLNDVYEIAKDYEHVYLRVRDLSAKNLISRSQEKGNHVKIIPSYNGNVIFSAIRAYNKADKNNTDFCEFSSKNLYGVIFSEFFANRFEDTRALISLAEKDLCGQRNDSVHGWESVISLGYSAVETDNEREFVKYLSLLEESYDRLERVYAKAAETDLTPYSDSSKENFEKYINQANGMLKSHKVSSQREIDECIENIEKSFSELQLAEGEEDNKTFSVTPMKIFWIAFALALFISSQVYLHRKTKKAS